MSGERALWSTVRRKLSPFGKLERVENKVALGTPDCCYCLRHPKDRMRPATGWIELKHGWWPRRATTPVTVASLTLDQVVWLEEWARAGGRAWLLLQMGYEYLLLDARATRDLYDRAFYGWMLRQRASVYSRTKFPTKEILSCLTG